MDGHSLMTFENLPGLCFGKKSLKILCLSKLRNAIFNRSPQNLPLLKYFSGPCGHTVVKRLVGKSVDKSKTNQRHCELFGFIAWGSFTKEFLSEC